MSLYADIDSSRYRLLELNPELLAYVNSTDDPKLFLKSPEPSAELVLCTDTKTFKVREAHHSNSLFVMDTSHGSKCRLLSNIPTFWETIEVTNSASEDLSAGLFDKIPRYYGAQEHSFNRQSHSVGGTKLTRKRPDSLEMVRNRTPVSNAEFVDLWQKHAGIEFTHEGVGEAYLISEDLIYEVLKDILVGLQPGGMTISAVTPSLVYKQLVDAEDNGEKYEEPFQVVESVIRMFATNSEEPYQLSGEKIVKWFGIGTLKSKDGTELAIDDFIDLWTQSIPIAIDGLTPTRPLNLDDLTGNFVKISPTRIIYFTKSQLSENPRSRFAELLAVKSTWELSEIVPFIEDIRNKNVKMESFIMKYAKKKTVGKRIYVSAR